MPNQLTQRLEHLWSWAEDTKAEPDEHQSAIDSINDLYAVHGHTCRWEPSPYGDHRLVGQVQCSEPHLGDRPLFDR